jgi:hypothetical protein
MPEISMKLSNAARSVLTLAATRDDLLVRAPQLPVAAARQVIRSLLNAGLVEEIPAPIDDAAFAWRTAENGAALMLRATATALVSIGETASTEALSVASVDQETDETSAGVEPDYPERSKDAPRDEPKTGTMPTSSADSLDANGGQSNEDASSVAIEIDAGIAPQVNAFVRELMKRDRPPSIVAFLRRMERGTTQRRTGATGTNCAREMSVTQRRIVELCSRPEGATGKQLAEGCGWPSIAARATCQKIADRFGDVLDESPKANGRGVSFRMNAKPAVEV